MFNPKRLKIARERRSLTKKALAELVQMSPKTVTAYESDTPQFDLQTETVARFALALNYPETFFYKEIIETISAESISYRAATKLPSRLKLASESASLIAFEIATWLEKRFNNLPNVDLPDFSHDNRHNHESASKELRSQWGLGELSIKNMVHLLETKGVKVFSLSEDCKEVDAFSFWKGETPFIVLNQYKSTERSRFDAAHELAHLVLHRHGEQNTGRDAEKEADKFASAFLMPEGSIAEKVRPRSNATLDELISLKKHWNISLMAMIRRLYDLTYLSEWQYRQLTITAAQKGYRKQEPEGIKTKEKSIIFEKVFNSLKDKGLNRNHIAKELDLPFDEISSLTFNHPLFNLTAVSDNQQPSQFRKQNGQPKFTIVK